MKRARRPLVVVGDALLDRDLDGRVSRLSPDAPVPVVDDVEERPRPGGAGLAAALAARDGRPVTLIAALADDAAGRELRVLLERANVRVCDLGLAGSTPEKVRIRAAGRALLRLDRGAESGVTGALSAAAEEALAAAGAILVSDYGRGVAAEPSVRAALARLARERPVVWDPHPKGPDPVPGALLVTPNAHEAERLVPEPRGDGLAAVEARGRVLARRWRAVDVCVTLGARGALLLGGDGPALAVPAPAVAGGDPCGAGDRFAAAAAGLLADGALPSEAVAAAVRAASTFVAAGGAGALDFGQPPTGGGGPEPPPDPWAEAESVVAGVRAAGGTVVATGGCFDLLHAGHVQALQAARALGDCLVVCLNSDDSVRRLKGPDRPLVNQEDRAAVLRALACVDAAVVFDEDTPERALERLRPDVWAKGGDYAVADLPEAAVLERWGGRAVIVPYVAGRSTTRLIQEAVARGS